MKRFVVFCLLLAAGASVAASAESPVAPAEKQGERRATDQRPTPEAVLEYTNLLNAQPSESGEEVLRFFRLAETVVAEIDKQHVLSIAFSSDGKMLATGGADVAVWSVETGKRISRRERGGRVVAFLPDGETLAVGGGDRLLMYPTADLTLISTSEAVSGGVLSVAVSPHGNQVAAVGRWRLWLFDVAAKLQRNEIMSNVGQESQRYAYTSAGSRVVAYSPHGDVIVCGPWFNRPGRGKPVGKLVLWDVRNWKPLATLDDTPYIGAVDFSADGKLLAASDERYRNVQGDYSRGRSGPILRPIRIWDAKTGKPVTYNSSSPKPDHVRFRHQATRRVSVSFSPDGEILVTGGYRTICLWDLTTRNRLLALKASSVRDVVVKFSPDGSKLAISTSKNVKICDTAKLLALAAEADKR